MIWVHYSQVSPIPTLTIGLTGVVREGIRREVIGDLMGSLIRD
ncbi:MAG: hypothetical protein ABIK81_03755 [candidate division WOR-3 bacterium]